MIGLGLGMVTLSVLLLSAFGIYAMTSFAVARRRREIGIRAALGANPRVILASIFRRTALQVGIGIAVGLTIAVGLDRVANGEFMASRRLILLPVVSLIMVAVVLVASIGPARRGLRIQPTEALKQE
jgi:ABC-type antimicrobial peptide transport system permease subunit